MVLTFATAIAIDAELNKKYAPPPIFVRLNVDEQERYGLGRLTGGDHAGLVLDGSELTGSTKIFHPEYEAAKKNSIKEIQRVFGFNQDKLASVLNVKTRKTVSSWMNEKATPHESKTERILMLLSIAKSWKSYGYDELNRYLYDSVIRDTSVYDLLCNKTLDEDRILFAGSRLAMKYQSLLSTEDRFM